jgi:ubiquinone/menaquinone biosynthesis C-methylase UbiE
MALAWHDDGVSRYANYDVLSSSYDATRGAIAAELVLGCLSTGAQRLERMHVLDAGCGTGNYCRALVECVATVTGVDRSDEMLAVAERKLATSRSDKVRLLRGDLHDLPFDASTFDGILAIQVLHHLDPPGSRDRPVLRGALKEFARVMRAGGALVIGTCSHLQLARSFWHLDLLPRASRETRRRYPRLRELVRHLADAGFAHVGNAVPTEAILQGAGYLDATGPLRTEWRDGDSSWSLASPEETAVAVARVQSAAARGDAWRLAARREGWRRALGQVTFVYATRTA